MSDDPKPDAEADAPKEEAAPKKTSLIVHIVVFLLITCLAAGAGFGVSMFLDPGDGAKKAQYAVGSESPDGDNGNQGEGDSGDGEADGEKSEDGEEGVKQAYAKPLAPILTNLAAPEDVWVRMELAVVGKPNLTDALLEQIHQDLFAYMRTVKLHHVEGPSGYNNLRAELSERAMVRSGGAAQAVLVRTLVFE
ncbi:MAG: flagellar basal body-associated FliL family protein [Rhizobiaceae bacterium]